MFIKELKIRNFRSIVKTDLLLNNISVFVGYNDVGKSNILKALNLFFNNETDYEKPMTFSEDYSRYTPFRKKKAEEIIIELIINAPNNYKGAKDIKWTKIWRKTGFYNEDIIFVDGTGFPKKSKLYSWLKNLRFTYVPAIRDKSYFKIILGKLHDTLAETIEQELRNAGEDFISKIKANTEPMILEILKRIDINSQIRFPANLQSLFKTLDFATSDGKFDISLDNRGDGVKTRHVPAILKFISDQLNRNKVKGSPNVSMIWGYEEPENNLEMLIAYNLANQFIDYSENIQLLLTTHSPAFYSLKSRNASIVNLFKVIKPVEGEAETKMLESLNTLDSDMGIMPIIAPYVNKKVEEINQLKKNIEAYKVELSKLNKNVIFVEGDDEVRIFTKILKDLKKEATIKVSKDGLGCSGVKNQLMAWSWVSGTAQFKAFGIFDNDNSGNAEFNKLKAEKQYIDAVSKGKVKAILYKVPVHLTKVKNKMPLFPIELEEMYPPNIWDLAENKGWLEKRTPSELNSFVSVDSVTQNLIEKIATLGLSPDESRYIEYCIPDKHKDKISKFIISDSAEIKDDKYGEIKNLIENVVIPFFERS
jgi:hypothetical protein